MRIDVNTAYFSLVFGCNFRESLNPWISIIVSSPHSHDTRMNRIDHDCIGCTFIIFFKIRPHGHHLGSNHFGLNSVLPIKFLENLQKCNRTRFRAKSTLNVLNPDLVRKANDAKCITKIASRFLFH